MEGAIFELAGLGKFLRTNVRGECVGPSAMKVRSWSLGIVLEIAVSS